MTPLDKTLKRTLRIGGRDYVITLTPAALKLTGKGRRLGLELAWADLISGETALAIALQASVGRLQSTGSRPSPNPRPKGKAGAGSRGAVAPSSAPKLPRNRARRSPSNPRSR